MPNAKKYAAQFYATRRELQGVTANGVKRMAGLITDLRGDIADKLKSYSPGDPDAPFTVRILPRLTTSINDSLETYLNGAGDIINSDMASAFDLGAGDLLKAARAGAVDFELLQPSVSKELLIALSNSTGDVLSEITSDLGDRIISQIRLNAAGLQPASYAIQNISRMIADSDEVEQNLRRRIGFDAQAEAIVRTETQRAFSVAHQAASEDFAKVIPGLMKVWVASGNGRQTHVDAEERYSVGGSEGPIPVDQYFEVEDDSRAGESEFFTFGGRGGQRVARTAMHPRSGVIIHDRLLFPRDPNGSPGNVINCFISGTMVLTEHGERPIESIRRGEKVFTHESRWMPVVKNHTSHFSGNLVHIKLRSGKNIFVTPSHKFFIPHKGWVDARLLEHGNKLLDYRKLISQKDSVGEIEHPYSELIHARFPTMDGAALCSVAFQSDLEVGKENVDVIRRASDGRTNMPLRFKSDVENFEPSVKDDFGERNGFSMIECATKRSEVFTSHSRGHSSPLVISNPLNTNAVNRISDWDIKQGQKFSRRSDSFNSKHFANVFCADFFNDIFFIKPFLKRLINSGLTFFNKLFAFEFSRTRHGTTGDSHFLMTRTKVNCFSANHTRDIDAVPHHNCYPFNSHSNAMLHDSEIVGISQRGFSGIVYNLMVEEDSSYFASGVLSRNCGCSVLNIVPGLEEAGELDEKDVSEE